MRYEFQHRGTIHCHMVMSMENGPTLKEMDLARSDLPEYPKVYECQNCDNQNKLKRIPKRLKHRIIHFALRLRVYYYQCDDCYKKQLIIITKKR